MTAFSALIRRRPLLWAALLVALVKSLQLAIDSTALFCWDSGAYILNALGMAFLPDRSYLYGCLIRIFAVPFHSLRAIVAMQVVLGGLTAWLLAFVLIRFLKASAWIGIGAALAFVFDPEQIVHEHLVMTETATLLIAAIYLVGALAYLEKPASWMLALLAFLGTILVAVRIVYLPVVLASAVLLPLFAGLRPRRLLALALAVSCGSTVLCQLGYRRLIGSLAGREPAYHYLTGFFLAACVAPVVRSEDIDDPRVAEAVAEQNKSGLPLSDRDQRASLLFGSQSLAARLLSKFNGDRKAANQAAVHLALRTIQKHPLSFLRLGLHTYHKYWQEIPELRAGLPWENGSPPINEVADFDLRTIQSVFGVDVSHDYLLQTPSRLYHIRARNWCVFLLLSPYLSGLAAWLTRKNRTGVAFLFAWSCILLAATCLGGIEHCYRFLHPFSFTGLAAVAVLARSQNKPKLESLDARFPAGSGFQPRDKNARPGDRSGPLMSAPAPFPK
jgi:hypothetical protein